jgi:outer membrane protein TolC
MQNAHVNLNLARSQFLPTASAGFSSGYNMGSSVHDYGTSNVQASANLSLSGVTDLARNVRMKHLEVEQANLRFESIKNDLVRNVRKKYYALLAAQRTVEIRTQSREVYEDQYKRTAEYYRLGLRPKVDVTTAEVNLNNESLRLIRAKNAIKTASASLANTLGVTTSAILQVEDDMSFDQPNLTLEEAVKTAYENRPDVQSSALDLRLGDLKVSQAKAGYFPTLSFSAGYTKSGETLYLDSENARVGVGLEIPLFNAFRTYNSVKQATLALESTRNDVRSLLNNVFLEVQNAYIALDEAAESIPLAELNAQKAKENMELARGRYNEGISDMIELKDAEVAYTDAQISLLTARYDYGAAVADLKQAMGTY